VAPRESIAWLRGLADDVVCLRRPDPFFAIGE
jgi:predicted phosphoribosyltransferase